MNKSVLLAGVLGGSLFLGGCASRSPQGMTVPEKEPAVQEEMMAPETASTDGKNSLSVTNQKNGKSISIASATLEKQGFVMLLKSDESGNPTDMVGVSEAFSGEKKDVPIELMESFKAGDKLFAMLHTDANTNNKFEWPGADQPITTNEGVAIMQEFNLE